MISERSKQQLESEKRFGQLNVVLVGLPGAGKSSLINSLTIRPNYLSLGDITRKELTNNGPMASAIRAKFETNDPWPADFVMEIIEPYLLRAKYQGSGFVLDGMPRKVSEALVLAEWMKDYGLNLDLLLCLQIDPSLAISRIPRRDNRARLETSGHYESRIKTYLDEEKEMLALMQKKAKRTLVIDTGKNSIEEARKLLFEGGCSFNS